MVLSGALASLCALPSQLLYSTYLLTSAERAIDAGEELRREVYGQLTPPFEELFDGVEEHALRLLLEPWALLLGRDGETFQEVTAAHPRLHLILFRLGRRLPLVDRLPHLREKLTLSSFETHSRHFAFMNVFMGSTF